MAKRSFASIQKQQHQNHSTPRTLHHHAPTIVRERSSKMGVVPRAIFVLLVVSSCLSICGARCREEEERALLAIKDSIIQCNGNGSTLHSWVAGKDCCRWEGILCRSPTNRVIGICLNEVIDDERTWHPNLTLFTHFSELQYLQISQNHMSGTMQAFCKLRKLQVLLLDHNLITGSIHPCLGSMHSLRLLDLSSNQLEGNIPSFIFSNLSSIEYIDISHNKLSGIISFSIFANLSVLNVLELSSNYQLDIETESPFWRPSFQLSDLNMANCRINQQSSKGFPSFISTQRFLVHLDMSNASLSVSISSFLNLLVANSTNIKVRDDKPSLKLVTVYISHNYIHGSLPDNMSLLLPRMRSLDLSHNYLHGRIPSSFSSLSHLDLSYNFFSGAIPPMLTTNASRLQYLILSNNSLHGEMLPRDSVVAHLEVLFLDSNSFTGSISSNISNSPLLRRLNMRNNQLSGKVTDLPPLPPNLEVVLLDGNLFEGSVPPQLCQLARLHVLDLSNNRFCGSIPSCLNNITILANALTGDDYRWSSNPINFTTKGRTYPYDGWHLTRMTGIDMSHNLLAGLIPSEMGSLKNLHSLNLSHNFLVGSLPSSFGNLKNIESLDLSHNKLAGSVPPDLIQLHSLSIFSVAFNNLSGKIPFDGQFSTFTADSYLGNSALCGKPLEQDCSSRDTSSTHFTEEVQEENGLADNDLFFYSVMAIAYASGLWATIGFLVFNNKWQKKFCSTVDGLHEFCYDKIF